MSGAALGLVGFSRSDRADHAAHAGGHRHGHGRGAGRDLHHRLERGRFHAGPLGVRGGLSVFAVDRAAVCCHGCVRRPRRLVAFAVQLCRGTDWSRARRHGDGHDRCLHHFRCDLRLGYRHRGDHGAGGLAGDEAAGLFGRAGLGVGGCRRHAGRDDPALDPVRDLWPDDRAVDRQAVPLRHPAGPRSACCCIWRRSGSAWRATPGPARPDHATAGPSGCAHWPASGRCCCCSSSCSAACTPACSRRPRRRRWARSAPCWCPGCRAR